MIKLRTENGWLSGDGSGERGVYGVLTTKSASSIGVRREDTTLITCSLPAGLDLSLFRLGEKEKLHCHLAAGKWVFASLHGENASINEQASSSSTPTGPFRAARAARSPCAGPTVRSSAARLRRRST